MERELQHEIVEHLRNSSECAFLLYNHDISLGFLTSQNVARTRGRYCILRQIEQVVEEHVTKELPNSCLEELEEEHRVTGMYSSLALILLTSIRPFSRIVFAVLRIVDLDHFT